MSSDHQCAAYRQCNSEFLSLFRGIDRNYSSNIMITACEALILQIAEKKRKEAEEKAAKRAEDTQEERKVLNYLSTQAAHLETRAMSPLVGGGFPQGSLPEGLATSTTVVPGTRLSYVDLTRPERRSFGTDESLLGSPTRHLRGASNGSWSGPMGPAGSVQQPGHSNSLSSFGAGDSSAQDPHMTALNTVLGVDFIQDAPPRGNGSGPGPEAHTVRPHAPRWAQSGAEAADIGGTALPDLLREVQEDRMRLQAQHAEQLAGFAMEPSDRLPDDPDYEEHHLRKNQAAAAAEQLAYMEVCALLPYGFRTCFPTLEQRIRQAGILHCGKVQHWQATHSIRKVCVDFMVFEHILPRAVTLVRLKVGSVDADSGMYEMCQYCTGSAETPRKASSRRI